MRYYSLSEVMQDLHINNHHLYRLLEVACITPIAHKHDKRLKLISEEEYARIKAEHEAYLDALGLAPNASEAQRALLARVAELEAENARLKRLSVIPTHESYVPPTRDTTTHQRQSNSAFPQEDLPDGWVYRDRFAEAHGVPRGTAVNHINKGHIHETVKPSLTRPDQEHHYLTPEQQQEAVAYWRNTRGGGFRECDNAACSCHV